jgi:hypothetical protein
MSHVGPPPDVIADAGYATIAAGALSFVVHIISRLLELSHDRQARLLRLSQEQEAELLRLSQEAKAGEKMVDTASTFEEAEKAYLHIVRRAHGSRGDNADLDDGDQGPGAGQGAA